MLTFILEAALRSALMAMAVWALLRVMRVQYVYAQKVAWVLVLAAAASMPLVMHSPWLALNKALKIPVEGLSDRVTASVSKLGGSAVALLTLTPAPQIQNEITNEVESRKVATPSTLATTLSFKESSSAARDTNLISRTAERRWNSDHHAVPLDHHKAHAVRREFVVAPALPAIVDVNPYKTSMTLANKPAIQPKFESLMNASRIRQIFASLYLFVGACLLLRVSAAAAIAFRIWRRSQPLESAMAEALESTGGVAVRVSPDLATPVTIGSTVMLPLAYSNWSETKLRIVLAHEQSHVRQGDFYLQLAAAVHAAIFWFSPLGWWLQRKLSDLGEALSDRAGLAESPNRAAYAQILLEFAATPKANPFSQPIVGVAMARTNNISSRIDRILSDRRFNLAFLGGRKHAILTALIVPAALVAVVACIRVVPAVEAAHVQSITSATATPRLLSLTKVENSQTSNSASQGENQSTTSSTTADRTVRHSNGQSSSTSDQVVSTQTDTTQSSEPSPAPDVTVAPAPPAPPSPDVVAPRAPEPPESNDIQEPVTPAEPGHRHGFAATYSMDDDNSFAILSGKDSDVTINGHDSKAFEEARKKYHNNFIWFERDGKSYVITDPAILARSEAMFKQDPALKLKQEDLEKMQAKLNAEMKNLQPEIDKASLPGPEFQQQMAKLNAELAELQSEKFKHLTDDIAKQINESTKVSAEMAQKITQENMEKLGELQEHIGDIQGRLGEIQGEIGERQGRVGEKQGEIGERMGNIGEQMGRIGEEQGRKAEEASRRMKSILDQAVRDGKAKPVD